MSFKITNLNKGCDITYFVAHGKAVQKHTFYLRNSRDLLIQLCPTIYPKNKPLYCIGMETIIAKRYVLTWSHASLGFQLLN